jgi:hypothetical protein
MTASLAGLPLDYLIGIATNPPANPGRITEVGYDVDTLPKAGIGIGYCNCRAEKGKPEEYKPYRATSDDDDIWTKYGEGVPDPASPGFNKNIEDQCKRRKAHGFEYVEFDNFDTYSLVEALLVIDIAQSYGLKVIAKNVRELGGDAAVAILRHPNVVGCIVECDTDGASASEMHRVRVEAGKPDLPVWFVSFGKFKARAQSIAAEIRNAA